MTIHVPEEAKSPSMRVLDFLQRNPNEPFTVYALASRTGLTKMQANNAAATLARDEVIARVRRGTYVYRTAKPEADSGAGPFPSGYGHVPVVNHYVAAPGTPDTSQMTGKREAELLRKWATILTPQGDYVTGVVQAEWEQ